MSNAFVETGETMPTGNPLLTTRQQEIWQFLADYVDEHG